MSTSGFDSNPRVSFRVAERATGPAKGPRRLPISGARSARAAPGSDRGSGRCVRRFVGRATTTRISKTTSEKRQGKDVGGVKIKSPGDGKF